MVQNRFGGYEKKPRKHDLSRAEHKLSLRYLRKTIYDLMMTFDEVEYATEPGNSVEANCGDGRKYRVTVEEIK